MNSLFNAYSTALVARAGRVVASYSSCGISSFPFRRGLEHSAIRTFNYDLLLTRFCVQWYSSSRRTSTGKSRKKKSDSEPAMAEEKNAFYVVRKGDIVGVYKNLSDCEAQVGSSICDTPASVFKSYGMPKGTEEYLISRGLKNALYSIRAADVTEELFGDLVPCPLQQAPTSTGETSKRRLQEISVSETGEVLELAPDSNTPSRKLLKLDNHVEAQPVATVQSCILEFDGASKGNPGKAGAGAVLRNLDGSVICRLREGLGIATCNVAEYRAVILGLKYANNKGFTNIRVVGDSKLVCMQVQGRWKVKHENISGWYEEVKKLKKKFKGFKIEHVLRDLNSDADAQANLGVDLAEGQVQVEEEPDK